MRDEPDSAVIEIIDADPRAFGAVGDGVAPTRRTRADLPRWLIPVAVLSAVAIALVAALVWHPWLQPPEPPLTNRLLLDRPTSQVLDVGIDEPWWGSSAADVGLVLAEPGAVFPMLRSGVGRSAIWTSYAADSINAAYGGLGGQGEAVADVQGTPARLTGTSGSVVRVGFGPLRGRMYDVTANGLTVESALRFANSIGVENGEPVLHDDDVLQGMEPVGSYDAFNVALGILNGGYFAPPTTPLTRVDYVDGGDDDGTVSVSSAPDDHDGEMLAMLSLLLGTPADHVVHDHPAFAADIRAVSDQEQGPASIVAWHERGRFIVVSGSGDVATTLALAETAHEATEEEWAPVADQAITDNFLYPATIGFRREADGSITGVSATYSQPSGLALCLNVDQQFGTGDECAVEDDMPSPFLTVMRIHTEALLVALVAEDSVQPEIHVTHADGTVDVHLLFRPSTALPGPAVAVFLPDDFREAALIVGGKVVATM